MLSDKIKGRKTKRLIYTNETQKIRIFICKITKKILTFEMKNGNI